MKTPSITRYLTKMERGMPDDPATAHGSLWQRKIDRFLVPHRPRRPQPPTPSLPHSTPQRSAEVVVLDDDIEEDDDQPSRRQPPAPLPHRPLLKEEQREEEEVDEDVPVFRLAAPPPRPQSQLPFPSSSSHLLPSRAYPLPAPPSDPLSSSQSSVPSSSSQSGQSLSDGLAQLKEEDDNGSFRLAPPPFTLLRPPLQRPPLAPLHHAQQPINHPQSPLMPTQRPSFAPFIKAEWDEEEPNFRLAPPPPRPPPIPTPSNPSDSRPAAALDPFRDSSVSPLSSVKREPQEGTGKENRAPPSIDSPLSPATSKTSSSSSPTSYSDVRSGRGEGSSVPVAPPSSPPPLEMSTQMSSSSTRRRRRSASLSSISSASSEETPQPKRRRKVKRESVGLSASASKRQRVVPASAGDREAVQPQPRRPWSPATGLPRSAAPPSLGASYDALSHAPRVESLFASPATLLSPAEAPALFPRASLSPAPSPLPTNVGPLEQQPLSSSSIERSLADDDPLLASTHPLAGSGTGYTFTRLSELRGSSAVNYDAQFRSRPARRSAAAASGEDADEDEEDGRGGQGDRARAATKADKARLIGSWRNIHGKNTFFAPSGQRLQGAAAYNASKRLREDAVRRGLLQPSERGRGKKKKQRQSDEAEAGADSDERKAKRAKRSTKAKVSQRRKLSRPRDDAAAASDVDEETAATSPTRKRQPQRTKKRRASPSAPKRGAGKSGRRAARASAVRDSTSTRQRAQPSSSDEEAEWAPATATIGREGAQSATSDDADSDCSDDSDDDMEGFIDDADDDFIDI